MTIKSYTVNISIVFGMIRKYGYKLAKYLIHSAAPETSKTPQLIFGVSIKALFYGALIDSTSISFFNINI